MVGRSSSHALLGLFAFSIAHLGCDPSPDAEWQEFEGRVVIDHGDVVEDDQIVGMVPVHLLQTEDGDFIDLDVPPGMEDSLQVGSQVRVAGVAQEVGLQVQELQVLESAAPDVVFRSATGTRRLAVIRFNFQADKSNPPTEAVIRESLYTSDTSADAYFREASFNQMNLRGKQSTTGDIFGLYTVNESISSCTPSSWANAARNAAVSNGVDLSGYDHVLFVFPEQSVCSWAGLGNVNGPNTWYNGRFSARLVVHELGHNLALRHASSVDCTQNGERVPLSASCEHIEYGDPFDTMGSRYRHFGGYHKGRLGWLSASNTIDVAGDGEYVIAPIASASSGAQVLRIHRDVANKKDRYFYLEYRYPIGFDARSFVPAVPDGILVRLAPDYNTMDKPVLIDTTADTQTFGDAHIPVGASFYDGKADVLVQVLDTWKTGARIKVDFSPTCIPESCASLGLSCGTGDDGCGGTLQCGACPTLLVPTSDEEVLNVVGGSLLAPTVTNLYQSVNDGTSFAEADHYASAVHSTGLGYHTVGYAGVPAKSASKVTVHYRVAGFGPLSVMFWGNVKMSIYEGDTLLKGGPSHQLSKGLVGSGWADFTETYTGLNIEDINDLRTRIQLTNLWGGQTYYTMVWLEVQ